jgi:hypothetical protein
MDDWYFPCFYTIFCKIIQKFERKKNFDVFYENLGKKTFKQLKNDQELERGASDSFGELRNYLEFMEENFVVIFMIYLFFLILLAFTQRGRKRCKINLFYV